MARSPSPISNGPANDQKIVMPGGDRRQEAPTRSPPRFPRALPDRLNFRRFTFAKPLFDNSGYRGLRRVIDVSAMAPTDGPLVVPTRDDAGVG